ncbi:Saccharopine dehydrogenase [Entomophthora muscae]|uniref:Saccharopine dehydrogenase n=1 Tax=Entomophthora muscae TaxID=34485 RepID=A0ACC2S0N7_9FUNG|nr:Saccharopine dehydrogenase [Entomophthora muscae]
MLPREASQAFAQDLLPTLLALPNRQTAPVWQRATDLYKKKAMEASNQSSNL